LSTLLIDIIIVPRPRWSSVGCRAARWRPPRRWAAVASVILFKAAFALNDVAVPVGFSVALVHKAVPVPAVVTAELASRCTIRVARHFCV
jgi:hypothetical protein